MGTRCFAACCFLRNLVAHPRVNTILQQPLVSDQDFSVPVDYTFTESLTIPRLGDSQPFAATNHTVENLLATCALRQCWARGTDGRGALWGRRCLVIPTFPTGSRDWVESESQARATLAHKTLLDEEIR